ncbi:hypothetical protein N8148_03265 [Gammaproteobacteria bacterium]|nr:hypothetical protein [Gammaproteobacteria bacterium]
MEKAIEALIIQMQKNQKETSSVLEALVMKMGDPKDIEPALDALILQNKKQSKDLAKAVKGIDTKVDLSPLQKALKEESKTIQTSLGELKKKYSLKIKELEAGVKGNDKEIKALYKEIEEKVKTVFIENTVDNGVDKVWIAIEEIKASIPKALVPEEVKNLLEVLEGDERLDASAIKNIQEYIEKEVDGRYKPITTGVSSEVKLTGNTLLINGTEIDLSGIGGGGTGTGITWVEATVDVELAANYGYRVNSGSLVTLTLPTAPTAGDLYRVAGVGTGGWRIRTNGGQTLYSAEYGDVTGASAGLDGDDQHSSVTVLAHDATTFTVIDNHGAATPVTITVSYEFQDAVNYQFQDATDYDFVV